uniref:Carbohydrate-binding-like fold n=1 Tax=Tanacetum cinerariifolium TaxID=118510 RepID=A0A6L2JWD7_TANCI|nr:carbohydrate-binding-like fold [Tanacetum cinerariifolium]
MKAVNESSSSPFFKLVSYRDNKMGILKLPLHHSCNNQKIKYYDFKLSVLVSSTSRCVSSSSSHSQVDVQNQEFLIDETPDGYKTAQTVRVSFQLKRECSFGQHFLIVGDDPVLGLWDPNSAIPLTWSDGHIWTIDLDIPIGKCIQFKFIMQESNGVFLWQPGPDRILECFETDKIITIFEDWENPDYRRIVETDSTSYQELQTVAASEGMQLEQLISTTGTEEPKGYVNMKEVLVSDERLPVLVPGLSQFPSKDTYEKGIVNEPDPVNGTVVELKLKDDEPEHVHGATIDLESSDDETEHVNQTVADLKLQDEEPEHVTGATMDLKFSSDETAHVNEAKMDLKLPELDLNGDGNTSNLDPPPVISPIQESQDSYENGVPEMQQLPEELDLQAKLPIKSLLLNVIQWGYNVMQKLLNIFGIQ